MTQTIEQAVKSKYGAVATSGLSTEYAGVRAVAEAFGYSPRSRLLRRRSQRQWG